MSFVVLSFSFDASRPLKMSNKCGRVLERPSPRSMTVGAQSLPFKSAFGGRE